MAGLAVTVQFRGIEIWLKKSGKYSRRKRKKNKIKLQIYMYACMCISPSSPVFLCLYKAERRWKKDKKHPILHFADFFH